MSLMTKTVSSESSSVSDVDYDPITSTFAKLRAVISQEASLRKELDDLFVRRTEDAHIAVQNAQNHLEMVKTQEAHMREILETESAAANGTHDSASNTRPEDTAGREQMAEWERLPEPAMMSMLEQRHKDAAEKLRQEQEENDLLAKLEEERLAELERERLAKEEEGRLIAQEAEAETEQRQLAEERWAREERAAREEAKRLTYEQEIATELERIEREREAEEDRARLEGFERLEQEQMEAEMYRLAQEEAAEAEESEMAEHNRLEEARLVAEAAENELLERARYDDEMERQRLDALEEELAEEEARIALAVEEARREEATMITALEEARRRNTEGMGGYDLHLRLKAEAAVAEESLAMLDMQLEELEAQRNEVLRQVESARLEEASCRYCSR